MEKRRYALLGFILVIIIGIIGFRACTPQSVVSDITSSSSSAISGSGKAANEQQADTEPDISSKDGSGSSAASKSPKQDDSTQPDDKTTTSNGSGQSDIVGENNAHVVNTDNSSAASALEENLKIEVPSFDVLRVEPDGDVVIAGRATPKSTIEVVSGSSILGRAEANENGDFVVLFDDKLKSGDYQLVLRATSPDGKVATSLQTAIVSVPQTDKGDLLALVEEPGQASRMISLPQGKEENKEVSHIQNNTNNQGANTLDSDNITNNNGASSTGQTDSIASPKDQLAEDRPISVEAVEIEGDTIYVAGRALLGKRVNVYANDIVLGSSEISAEKRFLVRSHQPLKVGDYIIRADLLDEKNAIIATARVPFHREEGQNISAVAPAKQLMQMDVQPPKNAEIGQASLSDEQPNQEAALERAHGSIIIRKGDNLWTISKRNYGRGTRYTTIYSANRDQINNPDLIWPGQVFTMPEVPLNDDETSKVLKELAQ